MATVTEKITHDHRELEEYYNNIINATDNDTKARWQNQFTWELARHSIAEELVVYPAMEKSVPNGKDMAEKDRSEHRSVSTEYSRVSHRQTLVRNAITFDAELVFTRLKRLSRNSRI
jgi:hemerythrin-like domain-containing protein